MAKRNAALDFVALARKYGDLSNKHDLNGIRAMLHPDAVCYGFKGKNKIIEGMTNFRIQHDQVHWVFTNGFHEVTSTDNSSVRVEFFFYREWFQDSKAFQCNATEYIDFCSYEGLIKCIGYTKEPTSPIDAPIYARRDLAYQKFIESIRNSESGHGGDCTSPASLGNS